MTNPFDQFTDPQPNAPQDSANPFDQFTGDAPEPVDQNQAKRDLLESQFKTDKQIREEVSAEYAEKMANRERGGAGILGYIPIVGMVDAQLRFLESFDKKEGGEATYVEGIGRGMMDVYEGSFQLATNIGDKIVDLSNRADSALGKDTPARKLVHALSVVTGLEGTKQATETYGGQADRINTRIENDLKLFSEKNKDFSWGRLTGGIATPLAIIPGGGVGLAAKTAHAAKIGVAAGLTQPVLDPENFWGTKAIQAGAGATIGAAFPGAAKLAGKIVNYTAKWIGSAFGRQGAVAADVRKFLMDNVTENRDKIIKAVEKAINEGDTKTVGQIIAKANVGKSERFGKLLIRLEKDLAKESDAMDSIWALQKSNRKDLIDSIAGKTGELEAAKAHRTAVGNEMYAASFNERVTANTELTSILKNSYGKSAVKTAQNMAEVKGINPKQNLTEFLHDVKLGLDKLLAKDAKNPLASSEKRLVGEVKDNLMEWMGKKNPLYTKAREEWQKNSNPINRMEVGLEFKNALIGGANKQEKANLFVNAMNNAAKTLKKSTGINRYKKLGDILPEEDVAKLNRIKSELRTEAQRKEMAGGATPLLQKLNGEFVLSLPHILSRPIVIANHVLKGLGKDHTAAYKSLLRDLMEDPEKFLQVYKLPTENKRSQMAVDIVSRLNAIATTQQNAREQPNGN